MVQVCKEAGRLAYRLEEYMKEKRKRDFEIRLLNGELEKRKKYPRGVPRGPSPEHLRAQRERDAEKAQKTNGRHGQFIQENQDIVQDRL